MNVARAGWLARDRIVEIYSPELAGAQTRYLSSRAELEAHEQALRRTERVVEMGAVGTDPMDQCHE